MAKRFLAFLAGVATGVLLAGVVFWLALLARESTRVAAESRPPVHAERVQPEPVPLRPAEPAPAPQPAPPPVPAPLPEPLPAPVPETLAPVEPERPGQAGELMIPVVGISRTALRDNYHELRGKTPHRALDIPAPRGTPVVAMGDGTVRKLFTSKKGGLTVYQFNPGETLCYYYAHLDRYAPRLREGQRLRQGDLIGYVGSSGSADPAAPHLHLEVMRLGPEKEWWKGEAVNPFPLLQLPAPLLVPER
jgi:murein DD-endopeptidase MepM/ murein hydrolase activator NlpD